MADPRVITAQTQSLELVNKVLRQTYILLSMTLLFTATAASRSRPGALRRTWAAKSAVIGTCALPHPCCRVGGGSGLPLGVP